MAAKNLFYIYVFVCFGQVIEKEAYVWSFMTELFFPIIFPIHLCVNTLNFCPNTILIPAQAIFYLFLMYLSVDWLWVGSVFGVSIDSISVYICLHILYGDTLIFLEYMTEKELPIHMKTLCSTFQGSASLLGWQFTITLELAIGFWFFCVFINTCHCLHFQLKIF